VSKVGDAFRQLEVRVPRLDPAIEKFYELTFEESRLGSGPSRLEELRTRELILRHLPTPPATVLDVGGASGAYAFWLAELGYDVRLIDASARLVGVARQRNASAPRPLAACTLGDARDLAEANESADVVLLLGPLYHLVDAGDRRQALNEAFRVLRGGGMLIAAGISRWADEKRRDVMVRVARLFESEPAMIGVSAHMMVVGRKP